MGGAKYFSVSDLANGFHQIDLNPKDQDKTALSIPYGHYEFTRMPFGLKNAPPTFQRLMNLVLAAVQGVELFVYFDDIVIFSSPLQEHAIKVRKFGLTLQTSKRQFL